jgi:hypothetical protein
MARVAYPPGVLGLLLQLQALGCEVIHYRGGFVGVTNAGRLDRALWDQFRRHRATLRCMVTPRETPYRRRQRGG